MKLRGKERPASPPTVFTNNLQSVMPTPLPKPRTTTRPLSSIWSLKEDEHNQFEGDKISQEDFFHIKTRTFNNVPVVSY